jgi:Leucine-rich repeat (LRR) protein
LSNNQLQILPAGFATNLVLLVELDLSKNQLAMIPDNFGILANLQHLDLYSNKVRQLFFILQKRVKNMPTELLHFVFALISLNDMIIFFID